MASSISKKNQFWRTTLNIWGNTITKWVTQLCNCSSNSKKIGKMLFFCAIVDS